MDKTIADKLASISAWLNACEAPTATQIQNARAELFALRRLVDPDAIVIVDMPLQDRVGCVEVPCTDCGAPAGTPCDERCPVNDEDRGSGCGPHCGWCGACS